MPVVTANVSELQKVQIQSEKPVAPVIASTSNLSSARGPTTYRTRPVSPNTATANDSSPETAATNFAEEQDSADIVIPSGARCKRLGCGTPHESSMQRNESECTYHPLPAIFHEGSKGYACCKRRVLEFDEFLRIEGCKKGKHCFVGTPKTAGFQQEERVQCRSDMYQTPTQVRMPFNRQRSKICYSIARLNAAFTCLSQVIASIFGKGADKDRSIVKFAEWEMHVDLFLPANKRFTRTFELYGPIDISASVFRIMGTKVEMTLVKGDGRSWPSLEASKEGKSKFTPLVTFGVSGRTGSVGAKEMVYRGDVVHA